MASACVNRSPDSFLDCPPAFPKYGWLSPRVSFSREEAAAKAAKVAAPSKSKEDGCESSDLDVFGKEMCDFEFRLEDPVNVLPADELFSDGKLLPLHLSMLRPAAKSDASSEIGSVDTPKSRFRSSDVTGPDPYLFSPKAPRCSSRWKELLGLKKMNLNNNGNAKPESPQKLSSSVPSNTKSLKHFLHRSSKSSNSSSDSSSLNHPLLKDSDTESVSISSRLSLSSSSSGHEHDDLPRLSLDSEKPSFNASRNPNNPSRVRVMKHKSGPLAEKSTSRVGRSPIRRPAPETSSSNSRGVSVDSPRMNSSGKIVFQSLERSSSSPSSFNGGPRLKYRGMERSYSANVRITPVLNVPVCSSLRGSSKSGVFGFQLFSSPQKKDSSVLAGNNPAGNRIQQSNSSQNRTNRS